MRRRTSSLSKEVYNMGFKRLSIFGFTFPNDKHTPSYRL